MKAISETIKDGPKITQTKARLSTFMKVFLGHVEGLSRQTFEVNLIRCSFFIRCKHLFIYQNHSFQDLEES